LQKNLQICEGAVTHSLLGSWVKFLIWSYQTDSFQKTVIDESILRE